jgi:hypothetical protein
MQFTTDLLFFSSLLKEFKYKLTDEDLSLLSELDNEIEKMAISYYPSSGTDTNDLFYANNKKLEELGELDPSIFIHSDYYSNDRYQDIPFNQMLREDNIRILEQFKVSDENKSIRIYKLKIPVSDDFKWLIFFQGYYNEAVLAELIGSKIKVPLVYSICDGMTLGNGFCNTLQIPTIIYPFIALDLGLKFIITEQSFKSIKFLIEHKHTSLNDLRAFLNNILLVSKNSSVSDLLKLSDTELEIEVLKKLSSIDELILNKNGVLRSFNPRDDYDDMVLKQLK